VNDSEGIYADSNSDEDAIFEIVNSRRRCSTIYDSNDEKLNEENQEILINIRF
jgi:hypothetical protein